MAGSSAEERIRAKVEASLRRQYPDARIIHELVVEQGGCRLDLAAVTPDELIVAEIKSEKDVLKRLPDQVKASRKVAQGVWIVTAQKHVPAVKHLTERTLWFEVPGPVEHVHIHRPYMVRAINRHEDNPNYLDGLASCRILTEDPAGDGLILAGIGYGEQRPKPQPSEMLKMLWAAELQGFTRQFGACTRTDRGTAMLLAIEHATGREIRRAVCRALRARDFPRADAPIYQTPKLEHAA